MFKIGCDPELFLRDKSTGKFISAHGIVPGTKRQPLPVECGAVQVDGMALEFNINPAETLEEFSGNIKTVLTQLREMVDPQLEFVFEPVAHFGKEYIDSQPDVAKELGCEPDYNAWTGQINPKPNSDLGFRTASGHVHIGWTNQQDITHADHIEACQMMVKQLDFYLGVPSLLWDHDTVRSSMYGDFGAYRPKHYGVEYRTLSNVWLTSPKTIRYVFNQSMKAAQQLMDQVRAYENGYSPQQLKAMDSMNLGNIIRYCNQFTSKTDLNYALNLSNTERPYVIERKRKMTEEMMFYHRETFELVTFEEAAASANPRHYKHHNDYIQVCLHQGLGKPSSEADAMKRYNEYITAQLTPKPKKRVKVENNIQYTTNYVWANAPLSPADIIPTPSNLVGATASGVVLDDPFGE